MVSRREIGTPDAKAKVIGDVGIGLVGAFNQEKALVEAFSVIMKTGFGTDGSFYSNSIFIVLAPVTMEMGVGR